MTKNTARIIAGIKALTREPNEIISGTVVSVDLSQLTIVVQPSDSSEPIENVMLSTITEDVNGIILYPKEGSSVVIASIDGPGAWCLMKASELTKAEITINKVVYKIDATEVSMQNGDVVFSMSDSVFKIKTQNESLFKLLKDCFTYLVQLTVPTPAGVSSPPTNVADFSNLLTRLNNLLNE